MKQTILVTGASSGFGLLIANKLHENGYNVIGTSRNPEKYQSKLPFKLLSLDISDDKSIESFAEQLYGQIQHLDVLINNAGYMLTGLAEETSVELGKQQFETNFWGTVNLTNSILPYFRKQKSGQIITVSSIMGLIGLPGKSFYSASKHALEGYFKSLRFELNQFKIKINMVEPMWSKTNLGYNTVSSNGNIAEYDLYRKQVKAYFKKSMENAEQPDTVVNVIIKLISAKTPKFRNPVGKMAGMILFLNNYAYNMFEGSIHKSVKTAK
ncbi:MAG: short-chain dehydrogenase/reductase [Ignavibacteria bacterium GWA2_35_9]|nr:MAG: short-chain dehydrogenase/reductase [Ignavibacteria bacterium GWA2_35_9]OGU44871.1 MAG: short-chain dehydrogenase/reductase [Ignavibacteria bacterium GWB2_36_8]OGU49365.1 MAG: short-chain dehydrogenase/reductase [Ignavibacteria bacterium GWC2_36_12]OGV03410.1 MAG: short-chain dehydrogenase/reductase [Ignavibacteria bacterium RIFOXYB2_FULL_36_7]